MDGLGTIERHSIDGYGTIGSLYDVRTDKLEGTNLFNKILPDSLVLATDNAHVDYELDFNNSQKETFNKLNIEANMKLSLLGGLVTISGSAKYLKQTKTDNHTVRVSFICKMKTKQEHLQISRAELREYFSSDALNNPNATHVVTGIIWGVNVAATFEQIVKDSDEVTEVEGALSVVLKAIPISGDAKLELEDKDKTKFKSLQISFSGDIIPDNFSQTIDGVMKVIQDIPNLIKPLNNGKGKPMVLVLYPLERIGEIFKHEILVDRIIQDISHAITLRIENIFEDIGIGKRKFNEFLNEMKLWNDYICRDWKNKIKEKQAELNGVERETQSELGMLLKKIRSSDATEMEMKRLLDHFDSDNVCSSMSIDKFLKDNRDIEMKIQMLQKFNRKENLLTKFTSIEDIILDLYEKDVYLLHISNEWYTKNKKDSLKQLRSFQKLIADETASKAESTKKSVFIVIDYDLFGSDLKNDEHRAEKCCIYYAKEGNIESKDYLGAPKSEVKVKMSSARWAQDGETIAGGLGKELNQLNKPWDLYVDDDGTIGICDSTNNRVIEWKKGATTGQVVAGGNGEGNGMNQLHFPTCAIIDKDTNSLIIADRWNHRVMRWSREQGTTQGEILLSDINAWGLAMDTQKNLYISNADNHEVRRYENGNTTGTIVAGGNARGNNLNQFNNPAQIFVDEQKSVYVSDSGNCRVMKWMEGATEGTVVAGVQDTLKQANHTCGLFVDELAAVYMVEWGSARVTRWHKGQQNGTVVVGGNGEGKEANQFYGPNGITFDRDGNLYVADCWNDRIQKFSIEK